MYSLIATVAPDVFPATFRGHGSAVAVCFEAAAVITVVVLLGLVLELRDREATSGAIKALLQLAPKTPAASVRLTAWPSVTGCACDREKKVPVDGAILESRSSLDGSLVTGESMPVNKELGGR